MTAEHAPMRRGDMQRMTRLDCDIRALVDRVEKKGADVSQTTVVVRLARRARCWPTTSIGSISRTEIAGYRQL